MSPAKLEAAGISGEALFDREDLWGSVGLDARQMKRVETAVSELDAKVSTQPDDVWEWRAANRRLCDCWLVPLLNAPHLASLWLRFFDRDDHAAGGGLDSLDDPIDESSAPSFWLAFFGAPSCARGRRALSPRGRPR